MVYPTGRRGNEVRPRRGPVCSGSEHFRQRPLDRLDVDGVVRLLQQHAAILRLHDKSMASESEAFDCLACPWCRGIHIVRRDFSRKGLLEPAHGGLHPRANRSAREVVIRHVDRNDAGRKRGGAAGIGRPLAGAAAPREANDTEEGRQEDSELGRIGETCAHGLPPRYCRRCGRESRACTIEVWAVLDSNQRLPA